MLFEQIVYGPIHSRRLGMSLGMNIMPLHNKLCSFNCVYCELGWNTEVANSTLPTPQQVSETLKAKLSELTEPLDVITFSGNGEPTMHPDFKQIIEDTCLLRDTYCPQAKVSVLSNSTFLARTSVVEGLKRADNRILKLDSAVDKTMHLIDQPVNKQLTVKQIENYLSSFSGDFTLQTCFLQGEMNGQMIDNTTAEEVEAWYELVKRLKPKQIMMYVIDRQTPLKTLKKIPRERMIKIAEPLQKDGFDIIISA